MEAHMHTLRTLALPLALALAAFPALPASSAETATPAPAAAPEVDEAALREAFRMGRRAFRHDLITARASDLLLRDHPLGRDPRLRGWVTREVGDAITVTILGDDGGDAPVALGRATIGPGGRVVGELERPADPAPLEAFEADAARARAYALALPLERCGTTYNTVVLPVDDAPGRWTVYLFPGSTRADRVPLGGSLRVDIDLAAGTHEARGYTRSCIVLQNDPGSAAMVVSHLLDPQPTDAHVYWQLWARKPLYVATSIGTWSLDGGTITLLDRDEQAP
jgi:hypothetical protein